MTVGTSERSEVQSLRVAQEPEAARYHSRGLRTQVLLGRELWSAVVRALNQSQLPYCILGATEGTAELADSDMDFAVRPCDYSSVPQLLASAAAGAEARLVQVIPHETTATYFVIARQQDEVVAFLHPDCTTDYRRCHRLWITSDQLLRERQRASGGYLRPAPDVGFKYYLIKQVLKQTLSSVQWKKLVALYEASPRPQDALSVWPSDTAAQIERVPSTKRSRPIQTPHTPIEQPAPRHQIPGARVGQELFPPSRGYSRSGTHGAPDGPVCPDNRWSCGARNRAGLEAGEDVGSGISPLVGCHLRQSGKGAARSGRIDSGAVAGGIDSLSHALRRHRYSLATVVDAAGEFRRCRRHHSVALIATNHAPARTANVSIAALRTRRSG